MTNPGPWNIYDSQACRSDRRSAVASTCPSSRWHFDAHSFLVLWSSHLRSFFPAPRDDKSVTHLILSAVASVFLKSRVDDDLQHRNSSINATHFRRALSSISPNCNLIFAITSQTSTSLVVAICWRPSVGISLNIKRFPCWSWLHDLVIWSSVRRWRDAACIRRELRMSPRRPSRFGSRSSREPPCSPPSCCPWLPTSASGCTHYPCQRDYPFVSRWHTR